MRLKNPGTSEEYCRGMTILLEANSRGYLLTKVMTEVLSMSTVRLQSTQSLRGLTWKKKLRFRRKQEYSALLPLTSTVRKEGELRFLRYCSSLKSRQYELAMATWVSTARSKSKAGRSSLAGGDVQHDELRQTPWKATTLAKQKVSRVVPLLLTMSSAEQALLLLATGQKANPVLLSSVIEKGGNLASVLLKSRVRVKKVRGYGREQSIVRLTVKLLQPITAQLMQLGQAELVGARPSGHTSQQSTPQRLGASLQQDLIIGKKNCTVQPSIKFLLVFAAPIWLKADITQLVPGVRVALQLILPMPLKTKLQKEERKTEPSPWQLTPWIWRVASKAGAALAVQVQLTKRPQTLLLGKTSMRLMTKAMYLKVKRVQFVPVTKTLKAVLIVLMLRLEQSTPNCRGTLPRLASATVVARLYQMIVRKILGMEENCCVLQLMVEEEDTRLTTWLMLLFMLPIVTKLVTMTGWTSALMFHPAISQVGLQDMYRTVIANRYALLQLTVRVKLDEEGVVRSILQAYRCCSDCSQPNESYCTLNIVEGKEAQAAGQFTILEGKAPFRDGRGLGSLKQTLPPVKSGCSAQQKKRELAARAAVNS